MGVKACPQCGANDHVDQGDEHLLDAALPMDVTVQVDGVDQGGGEVGELPPGRPFKPLPEAVEGEQGSVVSEPDYDRWDLQQLRAEAKERGLSTKGTRPELAARLREHDAATPSADA
ncbi:SAP domain-containing protein [Actinokineospora sp. UTMC 2448]|uniref:SAP domain-containing protein n=1 Tax=Actinokineospora sp. UTMC 2448 TaxID=2268449 RepID=UPI00216423D6|nr:SAP domain-containing protein [Actinokineospora sp. UTMC 2448]